LIIIFNRATSSSGLAKLLSLAKIFFGVN